MTASNRNGVTRNAAKPRKRLSVNFGAIPQTVDFSMSPPRNADRTPVSYGRHRADNEPMPNASDEWSASRLTDALIKGLPAPSDRAWRIKYDSEVKGFGIRCTKGAKSFVLRDRIGRHERLVTIGSYPAWTTKQARDGEQRTGISRAATTPSPSGRRWSPPRPSRCCASATAPTILTARPSTAHEVNATIDTLIVPKLGKLKLASVRHADMDRWHRAIGQRAPFRANRSVAYLSAMFSMAIKLEWCTANPCKGIKRFAEPSRERYLTADEIARLLAALDAHQPQSSANTVRLLLYTGARRGETLSATSSAL